MGVAAPRPGERRLLVALVGANSLILSLPDYNDSGNTLAGYIRDHHRLGIGVAFLAGVGLIAFLEFLGTLAALFAKAKAISLLSASVRVLLRLRSAPSTRSSSPASPSASLVTRPIWSNVSTSSGQSRQR